MRTTHIFSLLLLFVSFSINSVAQEPRAQKEIRYVAKSGKYDNDGLSWATAKNNVQDAINDLANNGLTGEVWVARGTYTPTESTESSGGSTRNMSFKVPAGITVRGGFFGPGEVPNGVGGNTKDSLYYFTELMGDVYKEVMGTTDDPVAGAWFSGETDINQRALYQAEQNTITQDKTYPYPSILSGDISQPAKFEWNAVKNFWVPSFYGNSYHVVWFAMEGFDGNGRAKPLKTSIGEAVVEGFTIKNGNARNTTLTGRPHNAYGGGVYMVQGSRLENCIVQQCEASRDGGGIYMDGGGVVRHCYISNCQSLGSGAQNGYGGGVCLETNKEVTTSLMGMYQSVVNGCVARMGGGVAIKTERAQAPDGTDLRYKPFLSASAIYNNTATTEAGGLYMDGGGAISNITITRNQCNGSGVIVGGMVTGRAGGLYCRDHAVVFNSVLWGNECAANNDIQYASSQSSSDPELKVDMRYCAVTYADYTDWSFTAKKGIFALSAYNVKPDGATASSTEVFPHFNHPTPKAGYVDEMATATLTQTQMGLHRYYDWQPAVNSGLANGGIIALDLNTDGTLPFKALYKDILGNDYNPRVTLGGYTRMFGTMTPYEKDVDGGKEYHFFVDPNATTARPLEEKVQGVSWDQPARFLSNVLYSVYNEKSSKYKDAKRIYIHVKEGTVNNTNSYVNDKRVREMTIGVRSDNLEILGGYPSELEGTALEKSVVGTDGKATTYGRNPLRYPTFISGVITEEGDYEMNAAHLMQFDECENVVFDGFQIRHANASSSIFDESSTDGGAIRLIRGAKNITFRNLIIAGNTADRGAAVFAEAGTQATFENCIIHNNEAKTVGKSMTLQGIIHTLGNAELTFNHCTILNNVGYPGYLDGTSKQRFANTLFFANAGKSHNEAYGSEAANLALSSFAGSNAPLVTGETKGVMAYNCLFDPASAGFAASLGTTNKFHLSYVLNGEGFPHFINGVHNIGVSIGGDETFYGRATSFEPHNENPMVNAAKQPIPSDFYNGLTLKVLTNATWNGKNTDLSTLIERNYGGLPDIGAIENHATGVEEGTENANVGGQQPMGSVVYVRDYNTYEAELDTAGNRVLAAGGEDLSIIHPDGTPRDGTSWANAINGNATYKTSTITVTKAFSPSTFSEILSNGASCKIEQRRTGEQKRYLTAAGNGSYQQTTSEDAAHEFRFRLKAGTSDEYYIFDETAAKYLYCTNPNTNGQNLVKTWDTPRTDIADVENATWYIKESSSLADGHTAYLIYPYSRKGTTNNWNYYSGGNLGLWSGEDNTSKWVFYAGEVVDTDEQTDVDVNGLQFAIDNACYEGAHPIYTLTTSKDWAEPVSYKEHYTAATLPVTPYTTELLDRTGWTVTVSSWYNEGLDGQTPGRAMTDGNTGTYWHSNYGGNSDTQGGGHGSGGEVLTELPEYLIIDLGTTVDNICALAYTPRSAINGRLLSYKVFVSETKFVDNDGNAILAPASNDSKKKALQLTGEVASGTLANDANEKIIPLNTPTSGQYILLLWCGSAGYNSEGEEDNKFATCAEINVYKETSAAPTYFVLQNRGVTSKYMKRDGNTVTSAATLDANALFTMYSYNGKNYLRAYNGQWMNATASTVDGKKTIGLTSQIVDNANYTIEESEDWPRTYLLFKNNNYLNNDGGGGGLIFWSGNGNNSQWLVKRVNIADDLTVTDIDATTDRIHTVNYNTITESGGGEEREQPLDVYVGAGTYKGNYFMKDGVSVLGGFPATGNPGEDERDISNKEKDYMTVMDGKSFFRVLTQSKDFEKEAMVEGFVIKNGAAAGDNVGAGAKVMNNGVLKNCHITGNTYSGNHFSPAPGGGGGVHISTGSMVKNSIIENNLVDAQGVAQNFGGGGVFALGGSLQNSLVVRNTTLSTSYNLLGGGIYIKQKSEFYNCTIAFNFGDTGGTSHAATGGVWDADADHQDGQLADDGTESIYKNYSTFYNCIVWGNYANGNTIENLFQVGMSGYTQGGGRCYDAMTNCYSSAATAKFASDRDTDPNRVRNFRTNGDDDISTTAFMDSCRKYHPFVGDWATTDFSLKADAVECINMGMDEDGKLDELDIHEDIVGNNRVIDCTVDKGAYEFSDSYAITPRVIYRKDTNGNDLVVDGKKVIDEDKAATFYVTPEGHGLASGDSPENAACAAKLQRVLDAAGRYKFQHPGQQIIVKVAQKANLNEGDTPFNYYATRTTDDENADVRIWSIIVPRGVEVWGGYSDFYNEADPDSTGFYTLKDGVATENRDITGNPTYFNSTYHSTDLNSDITTYHVVTFTDKVYDGDGLPYMVGDTIGRPSSYGKTPRANAEAALDNNPMPASTPTYLLMSDSYSYNEANGTKWGGVSDRAVIDGIYITGGQADLQTVSSGSGALNINRYGGAAIVTDFAHVRNCILRDNQGIFGGALALTHNALVSGCLIDRNTASYGGAIYVFEHGTTLSDGTEIKTDNPDYESESTDHRHRYDSRMSHVYSTTIVNNEATGQGGGVWYSTGNANVRFNSTVVWANNSADQPNVSGLYNITRPEGQNHVTTEYYPFNYCAVQNIRPAGLNNIDLADDNKKGARFHDDTKDPENKNRNAMAEENHNVTDFTRYATFGNYGLTNYSILNRAGMPLTEWESLNKKDGRNLGLSATDFMKNPRNWESSQSLPRTNIEIGARAFDKVFLTDKPMLRIYVAKPEDVDIDAALAMMNPENVSAENHDQTVLDGLKEYYKQEGSSFAYPMTKLQDALDYIAVLRGFQPNSNEVNTDILAQHHANDLPFEIYMGPGTYYPSLDPTGNNKNAVGSTFVIPEGVSIVGGFHPEHALDNTGERVENTDTHKNFLGRHRIPDYQEPSAAGWAGGYYYVDRNVISPDPTNNANSKYTKPYSVTVNGITYTIHHVHKDHCGKMRHLADINANSIVEPWELEHQTILSGQLEGLQNNGVNHIVTIHADQSYVGALPYTQGPSQNTENDPYVPTERGQIIAFDGITFTGGYAHGYQPGTVDGEHKIKFCYGGAILIDTNQYWNDYNKNKRKKRVKVDGSDAYTIVDDTSDGGVIDPNATRGYQRMATPAAAGYREVPLIVNRCKFVNNVAGLGGAIAGNTTLDILNCSFENNLAKSGENTIDYTLSNGAEVEFPVGYPGMGGAIYGTYQVSAINTLFANNEALDENYKEGPQTYSVFTSALNALEDNDGTTTVESVKHTILGGSGGAIMVSQQGHFHVMNCNFVRNQANAFPAIYTLNPNTYDITTTSQKQYNQALNSVFWGNAVNEKMKYSTDENRFAANLIVNYGNAERKVVFDSEGFVDQKNSVSYKGAFFKGEGESEPMPTAATLDDETRFAEQVWFSAYEKGRGKKPVNNRDLRNTVFDPRKPIKTIIAEAMESANATDLATATPYQNCNLKLSSENAVNEGPNFVNPSAKPGCEGYLESADWSPARLNSLTDAGWGKIRQIIEPGTYEATFVKMTAADSIAIATEQPKRFGTDGYSGEKSGDYITDGAYTTMRYLKGNEKYNKTMPLGDLEYMYTERNNGTNIERVDLYRISYDPNPSHDQTYVDIGVYEYNHTQLTPDTGDEVDIIWVSTKEKPENGLPDGSSWSRPTSDLQRAIETLLASRNDHRKEIRLMDGTFMPTYTIKDTDENEHLAFYINTKALNGAVIKPVDPATGDPVNFKGIKSLTIKGGYSYELDNVRNIDEYPTIIRQQQRTPGEDASSRWNHLFFIDDPTQRYAMPGINDYNTSNGGHWTEEKDANTIHTFPIQFDGVTLINDQANADTKGAAIHYKDLDEPANSTENSGSTADADGKRWITPTEAHVTTHYVSDDECQYDVISDPAKLIISKTKILGSGTHEGVTDRTGSSAVYIGSNGGHALLYNNVFHSNYGDPLVAKCEARTINNTFACNGGLVDLGAYGDATTAATAGSYIRNSVLWCNNKTGENAYGPQFSLYTFNPDLMEDAETQTTAETQETVEPQTFVEAGQTDKFKYNAFTGGNTQNIGYPGAADDLDANVIHRNNYNVGLKNENGDILYGPNFIDPENTDVEKRDFSLNASLRLVHKGSDAIYDTLAVTKVDTNWEINRTGDAATNKTNPYAVYDLAYQPSFRYDALQNARRISTIDIGAYEYQYTVNRIFYVDPRLPNDASRTGLSWDPEVVFGSGAIQDAINLAALYYQTEGKQAYVFVKGGNTSTVNLETGESLIIRDGVSLHGGINPGFTQICEPKETDNGVNVYEEQAIIGFVDDLYNEYEGYVGPNTHKTIIHGLKTDPYATYNTDDTPYVFSLVSGFYVSATREKTVDSEGNPDGIITEPVIDIAPQSPEAKVIVRDLVVFGNDISGTPGKNVANIKNALLYEALFRDNKAHDNRTPNDLTDDAAVLNLEENGWAASVTVEGRTTTLPTGETTEKSPYNGHGKDDSEASGYDARRAAEINNRIVNSIVNYGGEDADVPEAIRKQTEETLSGYNYRRTDHNMYYQLTEGSKHINEIGIKKDEDGNEFLPTTWQRFVSYRSDRDLLGNRRLLTLKNLDAGDVNDHYLDRGAFETWKVEKDTWTTGKTDNDKTTWHFCPHSGSVVYIMEGKKLICGNELMPGFLLLKDGASLYGNGHSVRASFISVERYIKPGGTVMSLPFKMDYGVGQSFSDGVGVPKYANATATNLTQGALTIEPDARAEVYRYLGDKRSEWNHEFRAEDSDSWEKLSSGNAAKAQRAGAIIIPANQGVFFKPSGDFAPTDPANPDKGTLYAFTAMGELWNDTVYVEEPEAKFKEVELVQYDDRQPTLDSNDENPSADFTSQENMGWNCIGLPYLVTDYKTHGIGDGTDADGDGTDDEPGYAYEVGGSADHYNMHLPHTLWLYYDGKMDENGNIMLAPDGSEVDGDGGFYSVPSWDFSAITEDGKATNTWHLPTGEKARIWWGEGIFVQTAAVTGKETLRFYRPVAPVPSVAGSGSGSAVRRFYAAEQTIDDELTNGLKIGVRGRTAYVRGLIGGEHISLYDAAGRYYTGAVAQEGQGEWTYRLPEYGVYIVKVNGRSVKVVTK